MNAASRQNTTADAIACLLSWQHTTTYGPRVINSRAGTCTRLCQTALQAVAHVSTNRQPAAAVLDQPPPLRPRPAANLRQHFAPMGATTGGLVTAVGNHAWLQLTHACHSLQPICRPQDLRLDIPHAPKPPPQEPRSNCNYNGLRTIYTSGHANCYHTASLPGPPYNLSCCTIDNRRDGTPQQPHATVLYKQSTPVVVRNPRKV